MRKTRINIAIVLALLLAGINHRAIAEKIQGWWDFAEQSSIANPASGYRRLAFKTDGKLYARSSAGTETEIGAGGGGGGYATLTQNGTSLTQRTTLNLLSRGLVAEDNGASTDLYGPDSRKYLYFSDDFIGINWNPWQNNGTTNQASAASIDHPGIHQWTTGPGQVSMYLGQYSLPFVSFENIRDFMIIFRADSKSGTIGYRLGFVNALTSETNGIYIEAEGADSNWYGAVLTGGSETRSASLGAVSKSNWVVLYLKKTASNVVTFKAASTIATAMDLSTGAQTVTATLPTGANAYVVMQCLGSGGGGYSSVDLLDFTLQVSR